MMNQQGSGSIIFTSSTAGLYGFPYRAPYCASKWAVIGMMKTIAMEAGPYGVRANVIAPGCVEGERIDGVIEREARQKIQHLKRFVQRMRQEHHYAAS